MKSHNPIYFILSLLVFAPLVSCEDSTFIENVSFSGYGNAIAFDVSSGFSGYPADTRSGSDSLYDDDGLPPLVMTSGNDTLYLHRYVASEFERATGVHPSAATRSAQVNSISKFKDVNGLDGFLVNALFADGQEYFPLSSAKPDESVESGDIWLLMPRRYWPDGRELHFNAFAPASAQVLINNLDMGVEKISFNYTTPISQNTTGKDAEIQPDLMFAKCNFSHDFKKDDCDLASLNFRHALAAIKFAVRDVANGEVVDISIKGVAGSGSCTFNPNSEDSENVFVWSSLGEAADYTQTFNFETIDKYPDIPSLENATVINNLMPEKTFMLIPQAIPENASLEITFRSGGVDKTLKGKLKTSDIPLWQPGKEYIYTISTSSENWTYVFDVTGSVQQQNDEKPADGAFFDVDGASSLPSDENPSNNIIINATITEGSFYNVKSYRYRTNNPNIKEMVAWSAQSTVGTNYLPPIFQSYADKITMTVQPDIWFPVKTFQGIGALPLTASNTRRVSSRADGTGIVFGDNEGWIKYDLSFKGQYIATDWKGDWDMRTTPDIGSAKNPIDLSKRNGGLNVRNTANCYLVNRGGWYSIPLYYGNTITNGNTVDYPYVYKKGDHKEHGYSSLVKFVDYKGIPISDAKITGAVDAVLVWQDAYDIIDSVKLVGKSVMNDDVDHILFHVKNENLQQSNSILAIRDANKDIMWSWHVWATEYWLDDDLVLNNGIIECETWDKEDESYGPFYCAPRNLGWCDKKNVQFLERTGILTFTQEKSGKTKPLNVKQRGKNIEYWIGNNTYYQWGRKDPMVGFLNNQNRVKYNYGELEYDVKGRGRELKEGILHPNWLFVGSVYAQSNTNDWLKDNLDYYNLWNNYSGSEASFFTGAVESGTATPIQTKDFAYSAVKTVYDPSPAGYVVPPSPFFKLFAKGRDLVDFANSHTQSRLYDLFNGSATIEKRTCVNITPPAQTSDNLRDYFNFYAASKRDGSGDKVILTGTGYRWDSSRGIGLGSNFNAHYVYLWTNSTTFFSGDRSAFSFALGQEAKAVSDDIFNENLYISTTHLQGRKSLARPIRCVKELPFRANDLNKNN